MFCPKFATIVASAAVVASLAACTSDSSAPGGPTASAPSSPAPATTASPAVTGTAPTAPTASVAAGCRPANTRLTYHQHLTALDGESLSLAPGEGPQKTPTKLPVINLVRAEDPGLGTESGLNALLQRHWHVPVARPGQDASSGNARGVFMLGSHSKSHNTNYAVLDYVTVYTGTFEATCDGSPITGTYVTFARPGTAAFNCGMLPRSALGRLAKHELCS